MRTISTSQEILLANAGAVLWARLRIQDSGGTWRDWESLAGGSGLVISLDWGDSIDARYQDAKVEVGYRRWLDNASPLIAGNRLSGYLDVGRRVDIAVALMPEDVTPSGGDYVTSFDGVIQSYDLRDDGVAVLDCRDRLGALLADRWIEADTTYGGASDPMADVIQDILDDWGDAEVLWVPGTAPTFNINAYNQQPMAVLDALREIALLIGADLRPRWRASSSAFEIALTEPDRTGGVPVYSHEQWVAVDRASVSRDEIRNVIQVNYPGATNDAGQREWATVWAANNYTTGSAPWRGETPQAGSSIAKYGRRWMEVSNGTSSGIDNATEAQNLANIILADLAEPDLDWGVQLPGLFWPVELNDYYLFAADGARFTSLIAVAVMSYRHRVDAGGGRTALTCSGRPKAGRRVWLDREARPGTTPTLSTLTPGATTLAATEVSLGARLAIGHPSAGQWDTTEVHRSATDGFTPDATTLVGTARSTTYLDGGLDPTVEYYYRTRVLDEDGNTGTASDQVAVTALELPTEHIAASARQGATVSLSGGQSVNSSTYVTVELDTVDAGGAYASGPPEISGWATANHYFRAVEERTYQISAALRFVGDGSATGITARLYETNVGTVLEESGLSGNTAGESDTIRLGGTFELPAGARVEVQVKGSGGTPSFGISTKSIAAVWPELHTP